MKIVPKLNLNKTPQLADNGSLIFAKNIRLLKDNTIGRDYGLSKLDLSKTSILNKIATKKAEYNTLIASYQSQIDAINSETTLSYKDLLLNYVANNDFGIYRGNAYYSYEQGDGKSSDDAEYLAEKFSTEAGSGQFTDTDNANFIAFLNEKYSLNLTSIDDIKFPVFNSSLRTWMLNHHVGGAPWSPYFTNFDYNTYYNTLQSLKSSDPDTYNQYFQDITCGLTYDGTKYYYEIYEIRLFEYFLFNHGNKITTLVNNSQSEINTQKANKEHKIEYYNNLINKYSKLVEDYEHYESVCANFDGFDIKGIIPYNTKFYMLMYNSTTAESLICVYSETTNDLDICNTNWNWSGGNTITGQAIVSLNTDIILNIAEYKDEATLIPFKSINLSDSSYHDDESIYTQVPKVPFYNLNFIGYYTNTIPNGTYQFFIRYKIRDNFYTNWVPASRELFTGNQHLQPTNQGGIKYVDTTLDSDKSFILQVDKIVQHNDSYKNFQVGFIIANDDNVVARAWKHFPMDTDVIYFDYNKAYIEEIDVTDLLETNYGLYNIKNVTSFKNKLYISNYVESNFNPDLQSYANNVTINIKQSGVASSDTYNFGGTEYPVTIEQANGVKYLTYINNTSVSAIVQQILNNNQSEIASLTSTKTTTGSVNGVKYTIQKTHTTITNGADDTGWGLWANYGSRLATGSLSTLISTAASYVKYIKSTNGYFLQTTDDYKVYNIFRFRYVVKVGTKEQIHDTVVSMSIDISKLSLTGRIYQEVYSTLIPKQIYKFYIHFVKDTGEITNGYQIGESYVAPEPTTQGNIIYPTFSNIDYPDGYVACFFTMIHASKQVAQVFNIHKTAAGVVGDCIELDTRLISSIENINVIIGSNEYVGTYKASFDSDNIRTFGASGKLIIADAPSTITEGSDLYGYAIFDYENDSDEVELIKCTPFITDTSYTDYKNLNLAGYSCVVKKLKDNLDTYISGTDIYNKSITTQTDGIEAMSLSDGSDSFDYHWGRYSDTNEHIVYSNFNLNYLNLALDLNPQIKTKNSTTHILKVFNSIELSDIYELKAMYRDYTRKTYAKYTEDYTIKFDNTVRSSELAGDEAVITIFKFKSTDYYNVPTNRGTIVNLIAIGDAILVHTTDSMFKFTGNNSLSSNGGEEIQTKETDVFDTGVSEMFGSEFGFAGLQNKSNCVVSEDGYIFYDSDSKIIYLYTGEGQMSKISDDIDKLFKYQDVYNIDFANDYYNDRTFINIKFANGQFVTLTYYLRVKAFISLHDFDYDKAFNTKDKCYFRINNDIYTVNKDTVGYGALTANDTLYPYYNSGSNKDSIIDVIYNASYETIKQLDSVHWIASKVTSFGGYWNNTQATAKIFTGYTEVLDGSAAKQAAAKKAIADETSAKTNSVSDATQTAKYNPFTWEDYVEDFIQYGSTKSKLMAEENQDKTYAGTKLRVYTDSTCTELLDITKNQRNSSITDLTAYKYPTYQNGVWAMNYLRNILNNDNLFNYQSDNKNSYKYSDGRQKATIHSDQASLIYGKFFVARFIFDANDNFKFENVSFLMN